MRKRKWYERMSAAVLIAVLLVNHGDMGIMAKAETITALEENLEEENKKIEAETASASNADEKRDTTVDSNETTESDLEKETATASNGKEAPEIKRKMAKSAMNAEPVTEGIYTISQTDGKFKVVGGSLTEDGENLNSLTDAFNKILSFGTDTNININFDNVNISREAPTLTESCELTLKGTYTSAAEAFIIGSNDTFIIHNEADITTSSYVIRRSSAKNSKNSTVIFEQNGGTVKSVDGFYMYENDVISLNGGTINGNARGNGGTGSIKIKDGTWNGQLAHIKDIDICGGQLNNIKDDTSTITAISESEEVSISGGSVFAGNAKGKAFAIYMKKNTQLTLSGNIDVSASGTTSGSIYYGWSSTYPVINAENVQKIGENFLVVPSDTTMKVNPVSNWIKGSKNNIEYLCENIKLKVVNAYDTGSAGEYTNYTLKAVGNYIRFVDENKPASPLKSGAIKLAKITLSSDEKSYGVYYEVTTDGEEYKETVTYSAQNQKVSDILNDIVSVNTGTTGPEITIGSIGTPIEEDITIDTGNADENKTTTLKGAITGKVNVTGSGTLQSEINCSGFYGRTNSEIHITDGQITGKENANDAVIVLGAANLTVEGEHTKIWDKSASGGDRYAIQAIGGVSVTIKGGEIKSDNNTAVYIYRSSGQKKDHATFTMEDGTITGGVNGLRHAHLNEINLSGGTITGGANQPDVYMAREINVSETANFTVEGNFPFKSMQIESASLKNEIDFTKATVTEDKKILISSPLDANTKESYVKLFKASTSNYQDLIKHIELTGGINPICVVYNANPVSANPETTEIYAFSAPNPYTVHVKYYIGKDEKFGYWRDTHLCIEGAAVTSLAVRFVLDWNYAAHENLFLEDHLFEIPQYDRHGFDPVQIISSGPDSQTKTIHDNYLHLIHSARNHVYIQTPYFIPDASILDALKIASRSGVDVRIMIPCKPDHPFVYWATYSYVGELVLEGANCYTYENGFLHAKGIIVDDMVFCYGTANMDIRSFELDFEVNAIVYDEEKAKQMVEFFRQDIEQSRLLTKNKYQSRGLFIRFKEQVSRLLSPLL